MTAPVPMTKAAIKAQLPKTTYKEYEAKIEKKDGNEAWMAKCAYGKVKKLTKSLSKRLVGKTVYGFVGQSGWWSGGQRMRQLKKLKIVKTDDKGVYMYEGKEKLWDNYGPGDSEPHVYFSHSDAVVGGGADHVFVFLQ